MFLYKLIFSKQFSAAKRIILFSIVSGAANVALLIVICDALRYISEASRLVYLAIIFIVASGVLWFTQRIMMHLFTARFSDSIDQQRASLLRRTLAANYLKATALGGHHIGVAVSRTFDVILEAAPAIVVCAHCAAEIFFGMFYLLTESATSVALTLPLIGLGAVIIVVTGLRLNELRSALQEKNSRLEDKSLQIMHCLRETRINSWMAYRLYSKFMEHVRIVHEQRILTNDMFIMNFVFAELVYFAIGGVVIFILPMLIDIYQLDLIFIANAASFMAYPALLIALFSLPLIDASAAVREIDGVASRLPVEEWEVSAPAVKLEHKGFSRLSLVDAYFDYTAQEHALPFSVGPINLTINAGEIVFITGVNGTGKSTLLHMLLALYPLSGGSILRDGTPVTEANLHDYYELFSVNFPDSPLSEQISGVHHVDPDLAHELLHLFEIDDKVAIENGCFSTIALSYGQRKRLSLIAALLEQRSILVLDEWAADQAPAFRATFYKKILPWIKSRGGTVIAITHDDAYFSVADLRVDIERGQIRELIRVSDSEGATHE
ncbi:putative ATP-binding cassette transporter [Azospirillaceae bacterium]